MSQAVSPSNLSISVRIFSDGERYPFLLSDDGVPLWHPTLFATTQLRNNSRSYNSGRNALSAIKLLYAWGNAAGVNVEAEISLTGGLSKAHVESFVRYVRRPSHFVAPEVTSNPRAKFLEGARKAPPKRIKSVKSAVVYQRLRICLRYLTWLATELKPIAGATVDTDKMLAQLAEHIPLQSRKSRLSGRRALQEAQLDAIDVALDASDPKPKPTDSPDIKMAHARAVRDHIVIDLYRLGLRGGEIMQLKVSDFDLSNCTVTIARRHNDISDPRPRQPVAKTFDRTLPLSRSARDRIENYIIEARSSCRKAKLHEFLLVRMDTTSAAGNPLSKSALANVVTQIGERANISSLCGHLFRHTAATQMVTEMVRNKTNEAQQKRLLAYHFGWSETGDTVESYVTDFIETEAHKAARRLNRRGKK